MRCNTRGFSYRLGRAREQPRLTRVCQRSDDRHRIQYRRPLSIDGAEDLVGYGAQLVDLAGAREPRQDDRGHRDDALQLSACEGQRSQLLEELPARLRVAAT